MDHSKPQLAFPRGPFSRRKLGVIAAGGLVSRPARAEGEGPAYLEIDFPGGRFTELSGINDNRQVTGFTHLGGRNLPFRGSFALSARDVVVLARFQESHSFGMNNRGDLVGMGLLFLEGSVARVAFVRKGTELDTFRMGNSRGTAAFGINDRGDIVGVYGESEASIRSFVLPAGSVALKPFDFPGASRTRAHGISATGAIVGEYTLSGVTRGFFHRNGRFESIEVEGARSTHARGINSRGEVVGWAKERGRVRGFLRSPSGTLTMIEVPGAEETKVCSINLRGDLVGTFYRNDTRHVRGFVRLAGS